MENAFTQAIILVQTGSPFSIVAKNLHTNYVKGTHIKNPKVSLLLLQPLFHVTLFSVSISSHLISSHLSLFLSKSMESNSKPQPPQNPKPHQPDNDRDFLIHLESYLAKRDGVDKLLKISRYASKIILSSSLLPQTTLLHTRLKSFESSLGLSRKAFRLGKFVQSLNALRTTSTHHPLPLSLLAYGGEGIYYFIEQLVWLSKSGLIDTKHSIRLQKISAWAELIGYVGSISLKVRDLKGIVEEEGCLRGRIEELRNGGFGVEKEIERLGRLEEKGLMKKMSIVQDFADGLMAFADVRDGNGAFTGPLLIASAGLVSALISAHKNWVSC